MKSDEDAKENVFEGQIDDKIEVTHKTTLNQKVVQALKNIQALYNEDVNKIIEQVAQEENSKENLNVSINLATIAMVAKDTESTKDEPQTFNEACNHANAEL